MVFEVLLSLIQQGSYLAIFLLSFLINVTVLVPVIPIPSWTPVIIGVSIGLNPLLVGLVGGFGSALGDIIGYFVGFGGTAAIEKFEKHVPKFFKRFEKFYSNIGFSVVLLGAFLPLPFDIIGVLSGASKYDIKKFVIALMIGRIARTLIIAYTGLYILNFLSNSFNYLINIFG